MGFLFLDDSNHAEAGFCLTSFVFSKADPQEDIEAILVKHGLKPGRDEFKSSAPMRHSGANTLVREDLKAYIIHNCKVGVALSPTRSDLYKDASCLLQKMLSHPLIAPDRHEVFTDMGLFPGTKERTEIVDISDGGKCNFHFEQNSKEVCGIQLADLSAHITSIMMKDELGLISKTVKAGENSGYDPDLDIELGFEMYATIRYAMIGVYAPYIEDLSSEVLQPVLLVSDYGLQISAELPDEIKKAAENRFSSIYVGCIH